ncbi:hypothetical protein [Candidatus Photodesmus blepharus]|uniref:hypothetical protein n=1 Tax=Candidatus Photodesmus blepharonis TaxID=1179155 RepID=UPI00155A609A|nr:hypothetical protein [Candidatus Photodesmus blepharus]
MFLLVFDVAPAWYIWILPFSTYLVAKYEDKLLSLISFLFLNISYLGYYILFYDYDLSPIIFLKNYEYNHIDLKSNVEFLGDIFFTSLKCSTFLFLYVIYKYSIENNKLYRNYSPFLIGIGGESGTGKTTFQSVLKKLFGTQVLQIEGDGDHKWERGHKNWSKYSHLDPKANWLHRQAHDLIELKKGKRILRTNYCHNTGTFKKTHPLKAGDYVSISGLHPFYLLLSRDVLDLKIFMDPEENLRRHWKIERDTNSRGYSIEDAKKQIESREEDSRKYIRPQRKYADIIVSYFSKENLEIGVEPKLSLRIFIDSSLPIESMIQKLPLCQNINFDYSENIDFQIITLDRCTEVDGLEDVTRSHIPNLDELCNLVKFKKGFDGFIQFIVLLSISEKLKNSNKNWN